MYLSNNFLRIRRPPIKTCNFHYLESLGRSKSIDEKEDASYERSNKCRKGSGSKFRNRSGSESSVLSFFNNSVIDALRLSPVPLRPDRLPFDVVGINNKSESGETIEFTSPCSRRRRWRLRDESIKLKRRMSDTLVGQTLTGWSHKTSKENSPQQKPNKDCARRTPRQRSGSESNVLRVINHAFEDVLRYSPLTLRRKSANDVEIKTNQKYSKGTEAVEEEEQLDIKRLDTNVLDTLHMTTFVNRGFLPNQLILNDEDDDSITQCYSYFDFERSKKLAPRLFDFSVKMGDGVISRV